MVPYLADAPEGFAKSCDVLLKLDDGSYLPAHSQVLARSSSVFANMLDDGPLSSALAKAKATVPLSDCSRATAVTLLTGVYSPQHRDFMNKNKQTGIVVASLAHRLNMKVCPLHREREGTSARHALQHILMQRHDES